MTPELLGIGGPDDDRFPNPQPMPDPPPPPSPQPW